MVATLAPTTLLVAQPGNGGADTDEFNMSCCVFGITCDEDARYHSVLRFVMECD